MLPVFARSKFRQLKKITRSVFHGVLVSSAPFDFESGLDYELVDVFRILRARKCVRNFNNFKEVEKVNFQHFLPLKRLAFQL